MRTTRTTRIHSARPRRASSAHTATMAASSPPNRNRWMTTMAAGSSRPFRANKRCRATPRNANEPTRGTVRQTPRTATIRISRGWNRLRRDVVSSTTRTARTARTNARPRRRILRRRGTSIFGSPLPAPCHVCHCQTNLTLVHRRQHVRLGCHDPRLGAPVGVAFERSAVDAAHWGHGPERGSRPRGPG